MNFKQHFEYFWDRIFIKKQPTAFARYADGQVGIIQGKTFNKSNQIDGWISQGYCKFNEDIKNSLSHIQDDYYYAISCNCCDPISKRFLLSILKTDKITYANLWINGNYANFKSRLDKIKQEVILVRNKECQKSQYPFKVRCLPMSTQSVLEWNENSNVVIQGLYNIIKNVQNPLILFACGPVSQTLIDNVYKLKKGRYIDIGSALDQYTFKKKTRPYMLPGTIYHDKVCSL